MVEVKKDEDKNMKGFAAVFNMDDAKEAEAFRKVNLAKTLGGASSKQIVILGTQAYMQTPEFKKRIEIVKNSLA